MRLLARVIGGIGLIPLIVAGLVVTPTVAFATSPVVGHVYVNDNTAGTNTIGGFDQHADGYPDGTGRFTVLSRRRRDRHDRRLAGVAPGGERR